tara:strand:+ start:275 stop:508 length:234 start_codon:yes stop_codon:yes gene_type:complete
MELQVQLQVDIFQVVVAVEFITQEQQEQVVQVEEVPEVLHTQVVIQEQQEALTLEEEVVELHQEVAVEVQAHLVVQD